MSVTRRLGRLGSGRGRLSLRSRLLAGLITVTALFLVIMGVVTTVVLGNSEQDQFNSDLALTARIKLSEIGSLQGGYAVAYYNTTSRQIGAVTSPSPALSELQNYMKNLVATRGWLSFRQQNAAGELFSIPGEPTLTAVWRSVTPPEAMRSDQTVPLGSSILMIARPDSAVGNEVRRLVAAELITGVILLALLALGGRWLISRGLAPLDRMASTADMITSRGDLTARMPDPGDHAEAGRLAAAINTMLDRIQQAVEPSRPVSARTPDSLVVVADEPRIRQVLANLLGNVREHTAPDTPVAVRLSEAGQGALLEVTDSGQGMDPDAAARAFDRFYRGGHNGQDGHGSGLGLAIVQAIAAAHGGHAMLKSAAGVGTSVQVWIPFHPPAQDGLA